MRLFGGFYDLVGSELKTVLVGGGAGSTNYTKILI